MAPPFLLEITLPLLLMKETSPFGLRKDPLSGRPRRHQGTDFAAPEGTLVWSVLPGTVVFAGPYRGYGNLVVLRHGRTLTTHYAHLGGMTVRAGNRVPAGKRIGSVGSTGRVTGPHLHFEMRLKGVPFDPSLFINIENHRHAVRP